MAKIQEEANMARAEAAKEQHAVSNPRDGETKPVLVVAQSVPPPKKHKERELKSAKMEVNSSIIKELYVNERRALPRGETTPKKKKDFGHGCSNKQGGF
jgi:hypothetical protein